MSDRAHRAAVRWNYSTGPNAGEAITWSTAVNGLRCLSLLRDAGADGLTRTELRENVGNRAPARQITDALLLLERAGFARGLQEPTEGRPAERWFAVSEPDQTEPRTKEERP